MPEKPIVHLIGSSPRVEQIRHLIEKLGHSQSPVLITGETGTGKEVIARLIHEVEPAGPFVPIDCSLLGTLLESELFGHLKGAFTGAVANKPGLLEAAEGGTAFFDEIGELPFDMQAKLLRVLQEKEIRPLGSLLRHKANFRLIAATNRDLIAMADAGLFRRDLFYRLNVITVRLPALRERREDVPLLVEHFLTMYGRGHRLTPALLEALCAYNWPGNVRELESCIQRMVTVSSDTELRAEDLPTALALSRLAQQTGYVPAAGSPAPEPSSSAVRLEDVELEAIRKALVSTRGDRSRAAQMLGIGRTTLYRRIKRYSL